jgi:hypothetical protein
MSATALDTTFDHRESRLTRPSTTEKAPMEEMNS